MSPRSVASPRSKTERERVKNMNDKNIFDYINDRWDNMSDEEKEKYHNNINLLAMEYFD